MTDSQKLDLILSKLDKQDTRLDAIESNIRELNVRVSVLEADVKDIKVTLEEHGRILEEHSRRFDEIEKRICNLENDVRELKLTLENEIRTGITRVAEAHLDLARNLHEAKKPNLEVEMLTIRVNILETDMRAVKQKIS